MRGFGVLAGVLAATACSGCVYADGFGSINEAFESELRLQAAGRWDVRLSYVIRNEQTGALCDFWRIELREQLREPAHRAQVLEQFRIALVQLSSQETSEVSGDDRGDRFEAVGSAAAWEEQLIRWVTAAEGPQVAEPPHLAELIELVQRRSEAVGNVWIEVKGCESWYLISGVGSYQDRPDRFSAEFEFCIDGRVAKLPLLSVLGGAGESFTMRRKISCGETARLPDLVVKLSPTLCSSSAASWQGVAHYRGETVARIRVSRPANWSQRTSNESWGQLWAREHRSIPSIR